MTVYVDDMRRRARVGRINGVWSHLMADTSEELLSFAKRLSLNPAWIQHAGTHLEHFDLTDAKRTQALKLGATPIAYGQEGGNLTLAKRRGEVFDLEAYRRRVAESAKFTESTLP